MTITSGSPSDQHPCRLVERKTGAPVDRRHPRGLAGAGRSIPCGGPTPYHGRRRPETPGETRHRRTEPSSSRRRGPTPRQRRQSAPDDGRLYLTFTVPPETHADTYLQAITSALVADGWAEGLPPGGHAFGKTLSRDGGTALVYP